jgi:polar amino acid transport system substrate-binding protein
MRLIAGGWMLLPLLGIAHCAHATCPIDRPIQAGTYEAGINFQANASGGLNVDLLDALAHRTGCTFVPVYDSRVRLWQQFTDGKLDMMVSVLHTPDRDQYARFVLFAWARSVVLAQKRADFPATPEAFLADHSLLLGTIHSYRYSPGLDEWINQLREQHRTYEAPDVAALLQVFDAGRVAAIPLGPEAFASRDPTHRPQRPYQRLDWFQHGAKAGGGLALSRARLPEAVAVRFEQEMAAMRNDGTLLQVIERYLDHDAAVDYLKPD